MTMARALLGRPLAIGWMLASAAMRGVHTEVLTLWQVLCAHVVRGDEDALSFNGLISFFMYGVAAVAVLLPLRFPRAADRATAFAPAIASALCGCALVGAAYARSQAWLALALIVYHAMAELFIAVASVQVVAAARAALRGRGWYSVSISSSSGDGSSSTTTTCDGGDDESSEAEDMLSLAAAALAYALSLAVEALLQLVLWSRWGALRNMFGLHLGIEQQFRAFGLTLVALLPLALLLSRALANARQRDGGRQSEADASSSETSALLPVVT